MVVTMQRVFSRLEERLNEDEPRHEAELRDVLADVLRDVFGLTRRDVRTEHRVGTKLVDVWIEPLHVAIELKYHRPIPSGRSRPMTQQFGDLLSDVGKLVRVAEAQQRFLVLLSDAAGVTHVQNKYLLPTREVGPKRITRSDIARLAESARTRVEGQGAWQEVSVALFWQTTLRHALNGLAWDVKPTPG